ncbi:hypothetical protein BFF78_05065 [Streptomyces fodineus]|uniref:Uncharacterized protein n=1 Tax=Streptomyces fodineus TaxID=1904616 RepID=A0A1D7Y4I1_9ACTN|nr:hypothetical protein [Streptomyces fodineus]AOR30507.1 hypothetical protein BFF78_05065 [Streptomyces fodineus]
MRCGICGSARLSPVGELSSGERSYERLRLKFRRPGFFKPRPEFEASLGRVCRDCGALFAFLTESDRRELDAAAEDLIEVEDVVPVPHPWDPPVG